MNELTFWVYSFVKQATSEQLENPLALVKVFHPFWSLYSKTLMWKYPK